MQNIKIKSPMDKEIVYKFRNFKSEKHKRWIDSNEIFFSSPADFNDPFDCAINLRYDLLDEKEKLQRYRSMIKADNPHLNKKQILQQAKQWYGKGLLTKEKHMEMNENTFKNITSKQVGVLSLTKVKSPILLWSHYADYHQGFCIGYDRAALEKFLVNKYNTSALVPFWFDVNYKNEYPIIIPDSNLSIEEYVTLPLKTKSDVWDYECEYRIILLGGTKITTSIPESIIKEVSLGCRISDINKKIISKIVEDKKSNVPIFQAKKHTEKFELVFAKIN